MNTKGIMTAASTACPGTPDAHAAIRFADLAARATMLRCVLRRRCHEYEVIRTAWGMSRMCRTLDEVEELLGLIGAR